MSKQGSLTKPPKNREQSKFLLGGSSTGKIPVWRRPYLLWLLATTPWLEPLEGSQYSGSYPTCWTKNRETQIKIPTQS